MPVTRVVKDPRLNPPLIKSDNENRPLHPNFPIANHTITLLCGVTGSGKTTAVQQAVRTIQNYGIKHTHLIHVAPLSDLDLDRTSAKLISEFNTPIYKSILPSETWTAEVFDYVRKLNKDHNDWVQVVDMLWDLCMGPIVELTDLDMLIHYISNPVPLPEIIFFVDDLSGRKELRGDPIFINNMFSHRHLRLWSFICTHDYPHLNSSLRNNASDLILFNGMNQLRLKYIYEQLPGIFRDLNHFRECYALAETRQHDALYIFKKAFEARVNRDHVIEDVPATPHQVSYLLST